MKKALNNLLDKDVLKQLKDLSEYRHKAHICNFNTTLSSYENTLHKIKELLLDIELPGIIKVDITKNIKDLLFYFKVKNFDGFEMEKERLNTLVECYLKEVDTLYNTNYRPTGALRSTINVSKGQIYWVERKTNSLFNIEDKNKYIPALVISPDEWNVAHDNYTFLSITKKDEYNIKDIDYSINFYFSEIEHTIRCYNAFSARKVHIGSYIGTVDEEVMERVKKCLAKFNGNDMNRQEEELGNIIERIIEERTAKIRSEMNKETCEKGMKMIIDKLNSLYPEQKEKTEVILDDPVKQTIIKEKEKKVVSKKKKEKIYLKWDNEMAAKFLKDYGEIEDKNVLAANYNFSNMSSVYTRKQRCMKMLGLI